MAHKSPTQISGKKDGQFSFGDITDKLLLYAHFASEKEERMSGQDEPSILLLAEKALAMSKNMLAETDWYEEKTDIPEDEEIRLESKLFSDLSTVNAFRTSATVSCNAEALADTIWNASEAILRQEDRDIIEWNLVSQGEKWRIFRQLNRMPWPIWSRETVCAQVKLTDQENGDIWVLAFSISDDRSPEDEKQYLRTHVHTSSFRFRPDGKSSTLVNRVVHIDPKGYIPSFVVNQYAKKITKRLERWKREYV